MRFAVVIACLAATTTASANRETPTVAQARKLYESGKAHFNLSEYQEALADFKGAYRTRQDAAILFNIAQCYRMLDDVAEAARYYRTYKRELAEGVDSSAVDRLIAEMDRATQERSARQPPTGTKPPEEGHPTDDATAAAPAAAARPTAVGDAPPRAATLNVAVERRAWSGAAADRRGRPKTIAGAVLEGVGVGAFAAAIAEGVFASRASDEINAAARAMQPFDPSKQSAGLAEQAASAALYAVGGAAVVAGAALIVVGRRERSRAASTSWSPTIGPRYAGISLQTRF